MGQPQPPEVEDVTGDTDWHRRVVDRSLRSATKRSIDRGSNLIRAAATLLERSNGDGFTVQDVADEAGQSLRTLYQYFESKDDLLLAVFEEAMRAYGGLIRAAIVDLDDPLERLAGAMVTAVRGPEVSQSGVDRGLARMRLKLSQVQPELVGRAQLPVNTIVRELIDGALEAGQIRTRDPEGATFMVLALNAGYITNNTLGNDWGVRPPEVYGLVSFCLRGLGATIEDEWLEAVTAKLRFPARPDGDATPFGAKPRAKANKARSRPAKT